jgi:hypothetical protein
MEQINSPKIVDRKVDGILDIIRESGFFDIFEIGENYARKELTHVVTEEYVKQLTPDFTVEWSNGQLDKILRRIFTGSVLYELKKEGIVNSYEDENTEEVFFLTEKGKKGFPDSNKKFSQLLLEDIASLFYPSEEN